MTEETLFHEALSRPAGERAAYLDAACAGRPGLRAAVEALLSAHEASGLLAGPAAADLCRSVDSYPGRPPLGATGEHTPSPAPPRRPGHACEAGAVIAGRYTLAEKIGEGGMGEVWAAQQTEPVKRRVALKLIKSGMDSSSVLSRFEQERQALALMDHPNIARVLDGGVTPSGQPFFVMELVNGLPLTRFCDEAKLTPRERLELFIPICQAVQHAHQKGIVHRDLKPANILVTLVDGRPVPKVIDFGVAKATGGSLTEQEFATHFGAVVGTLEYMSPEQAGYSGVDVDTRADVYSLGVILYELLTGLRPIDSKRLQKAGLVEMIRVIQEVEPSRPSTRLSTDDALPSLAATRQTDPGRLMAMLRGELDWVVMKCLEKERARRYGSASDLARDIQRYLADEPVEARPPSFAYRLRKTLWRNRITVAAFAAVSASLVVGLGLAVWQAVVASKARDEAFQLAGEKATLAEANAALATREGQAKEKAIRATEDREEQLRRTQAVLFTSQMDRVGALLERDPHAALTLLHDTETCPIRLRDLAWGFAHNAALRRQMPAAHIPGNNGCVFSPDGKWLAGTHTHGTVGKFTYTASVVEFPSGRVRVELPTQPEMVTVLSFSPDGNRLALVTDGETFKPLPPGVQRKVVPGMVQIFDLATAKKLATLTGHTHAVRVLAWSPDGRLLASGGPDGTVRVWDAATGKEELKLTGHGKAVTALRFHPDGKRLASGGADKKIRLWDVPTGKPLAVWTAADNPDPAVRASREPRQGGGPAEDHVAQLDFSPDGTTLVSASTNWLIEVRDVSSGLVRATVREVKGPARWLLFDRAGTSFLVHAQPSAGPDHCEVSRWDPQTGQRLATLAVGTRVHAALFNPATSVVVGFLPGVILAVPWNVFDIDAPLDRARLIGEKVKGVRTAVLFSSDGKRLIAGGGNRITVWDTRTGQTLHTLRGEPQDFGSLALSPDGRTLAAVCFTPKQQLPNDIRLWDSVTGEPLGTVSPKTTVTALAFSPDGATLALLTWPVGAIRPNADPTIAIYDVKTREHRFDLQPTDTGAGFFAGAIPSPRLTFNPVDGTLVCSAGRALSVWDLTTRQLRRQMLVSSPGPLVGVTFSCMAVSPDGKEIVAAVLSARGGGELTVWNLETGAVKRRARYAGDFNLALSPDGRNLVVTEQRNLEIWDFASLQRRHSFPAHEKLGLLNLAISPDGRTLASSSIPSGRPPNDDNEAPLEVRLWDVGRPATAVALTNNGESSHRFSPDSRTLIERDGTRGELRFWELATGRLLRTVDTTRQRVGLHSSADGRYLLGYDSPQREVLLPGMGNEKLRETNAPVYLLDTTTYAIRTIETGKGPILGAAFSPDARHLALIHNLSKGFRSHESSLEIWDLEKDRSERTVPFPDLSLVGAPAFSPDGRVVAVSAAVKKEHRYVVLDRAEGTILATRSEPMDRATPRPEFTPDGRRVVLVRDPVTGLSRLWSWRDGTQQEERLPAPPTGNTSPDGRFGILELPTSREVIDRMIRPLEIVTHRRKPAN